VRSFTSTAYLLSSIILNNSNRRDDILSIPENHKRFTRAKAHAVAVARIAKIKVTAGDIDDAGVLITEEIGS